MFENDTDFLDQDFLIFNKVIEDFVNYAMIDKDDHVVEIGPGKGNVTKLLLERANKVTVIELDERLIPYLLELKKKYDNLEIIHGNVLDTYIPDCDKIVTSLPYSIIEPFINKCIKCNFKTLTMIMGSTYIEEVMNKSNNKLALLTNSFFNVEKLRDIEPSSFEPQPRTLSGIIKLSPIKINKIKDKNRFIIRQLFFYRNMKIKNALKEALISYESCSQKEAKEQIDKLNIEEDILEDKMETISNKNLDKLITYINKL